MKEKYVKVDPEITEMMASIFWKEIELNKLKIKLKNYIEQKGNKVYGIHKYKDLTKYK